MAAITGYCVKCRKKVRMVNPKVVTLKGGKTKAYKGVCPACGTAVYRIIGKA